MTFNIIHGDCFIAMRNLEADSVHAIVTDPPYGIGFMGKEWDTFKPGTHSDAKLPQWNGGAKQNPNLKGRARSPAISPSQIEYDYSASGLRKFQMWCEEWSREAFRVLKPGGYLLSCGAPRAYHRMAAGIEDAEFEIRDCLLWLFGQGFPKSHNLEGEWEGWGTALKPAWEPIAMARKPFKGTVADNIVQHNTGAINIAACRVEAPEGVAKIEHSETGSKRGFEGGLKGGARIDAQMQGRWPANLVHDGSDCVVAGFPAEAGAAAPVHRRNGDKFRGTYGAFKGNIDEEGSTFHGDSGSAARFFYCAKTSGADRNEGCGHIQPKAGGSDYRPNDDGKAGLQSRLHGATVKGGNNHPTVKPTSLMRWLVRMVTPPGGVILDPFMGSGSTGKACAIEGFDFIGIEKELPYVEISKARIAFGEQFRRDMTAQGELQI